MRICFVVNNVRARSARRTRRCTSRSPPTAAGTTSRSRRSTRSRRARARTSSPRWCARSRAGCATRAGYAKALTATDAPREAARLVDFDVIFLRNNPSAGAVEVDAFNPALDFGRRLKQLGRAGGQRPRRPVARRLEDVPGRLSGRAAAEDADHAFGRTGARVPARAGRARHHQAALGFRRPERLLRGARAEPRTCRRSSRRCARTATSSCRSTCRRRRRATSACCCSGARRCTSDRPSPRTSACARRTTSGTTCTSAARGGARIFPRPSGASAICCGRAWSPTASTSSASTWSATRSSRSTSSRPAASHNINELYDIDVGTAVIRDLERKVELRARLPRADPAARVHARVEPPPNNSLRSRVGARRAAQT